jgi:PAS domain-containing protein
MQTPHVLNSLSIGLLVFSMDLELVEQNPAAQGMLGLDIGRFLPDCFEDHVIKGVIRRLQRGHSPTFVVQDRRGRQLECSTVRTPNHIIIQVYKNESLHETQVLLNNYSTQLEQQNFEIRTLLDESKWLKQAFTQSTRPIVMLDINRCIRFINEPMKAIFIRHFRILFTLIPEVFQEEIIGASVASLPIFDELAPTSEQQTTGVHGHFLVNETRFDYRLSFVTEDNSIIGYGLELTA